MKTRASASGIIGQAKGFLLRRASPWTGRFSDCATICRSFALGRNPNEISTRTPNERSLLAHGSVEKRENNEDDYRRSAPDVGRHRLECRFLCRLRRVVVRSGISTKDVGPDDGEQGSCAKPHHRPREHRPGERDGQDRKPRQGSAGIFLIGPNGRTLYIFTKDHGTISACKKTECAKLWPALTTTGALKSGPGIDAKEVKTAHGQVKHQVTYYGHLLYYFKADAAPGQTNGTSVAGWDLLGPFGNVMLPRD